LQVLESDSPPARLIRASEIAQYVYCPRAWWLSKIVGAPSANTQALAAGTAAHHRHGRMVWLSRALVAASVGAALMALVVVILSLQ
jgi:CRISPR/Cas system-associated exonuclease Cas4 (RecB family)